MPPKLTAEHTDLPPSNSGRASHAPNLGSLTPSTVTAVGAGCVTTTRSAPSSLSAAVVRAAVVRATVVVATVVGRVVVVVVRLVVVGFVVGARVVEGLVSRQRTFLGRLPHTQGHRLHLHVHFGLLLAARIGSSVKLSLQIIAHSDPGLRALLQTT